MTVLSTTYATGDPNPAGALNTTNTQVNANTTAISTNTSSIASNSSAITALQALVPTAALLKASNLSDLPSAATARTNLGLAGAAVLAVGSTAGTVAAGDDSRITGAVQSSTLTAKGDIYVATASGTIARLAVGADGTVAVADSGATPGISYRNKAFLTQFIPYVPQTGEYLASAGTSTGTASAYTSGHAYFEPIDIAATKTFDRIGTSITATGTGSGNSMRLGIYPDDGTLGRPVGAAIVDAGTVDCTSGTGDKLLTISWTPTPGRYWLCAAFQGTLTTSPTVVTNALVNNIGLANLGNNSNRCWGLSSVSGALPTIVAGTLYRDSNPPMIAVRAT